MSEAYIGEIRSFAFVPDRADWLPCDGRYLPTTGPFQALFGLIDYTYGGDLRKGFRLPDLRGRVMVGRGHAASGTEYVLGAAGGEEEVALGPSEVPPHTHRWSAEDQSPDAIQPTNAFLGISTAGELPFALYAEGGNTVQLAEDTIGAAPNRPHPNVQPYVGIGHYICVNGIMPPRP
jgi:microcystin-dependent protein